MPSAMQCGNSRLLGVQVGKRADGVGLGVVGHQIALVQVGADGVGTGGRAAEVETGMECAVALRRALEHLSPPRPVRTPCHRA